MIVRTGLFLVIWLVALAACSGSRQSNDVATVDSGPAPSAIEHVTTKTPAPERATDATQATAGTAGEVDYSCQTDADCTIKNVGNCCGYYPACVNVDSPTFPEQVMADCAATGRSGVCGFPSISGCQCVEGRCEGIRGMMIQTPSTK